MNKIKELISAEDKLLQLYLLQKIHSKIDELTVLQGELPEEVQDLEDELTGLETRIGNFESEMEHLNTQTTNYQQTIYKAEELIVKYENQQMNVKNNREFDALSKEIEMQNLEIELAKKRIRDTGRDIDAKRQNLQDAQRRRDLKKRDLEMKKKELEVITAETEKEQSELHVLADKASQGIEERLLNAYTRIRTTYRNGLAVVLVDRDSCGGCFGKIPPQRQIEIRQHKKITLCEHCGRILVDPRIDPDYEEDIVID